MACQSDLCRRRRYLSRCWIHSCLRSMVGFNIAEFNRRKQSFVRQSRRDRSVAETELDRLCKEAIIAWMNEVIVDAKEKVTGLCLFCCLQGHRNPELCNSHAADSVLALE